MDEQKHEEQLTEEDRILYVRIFEHRSQPEHTGSSTPSPQAIADYHRELDTIAAAQKHAEAHSAGLLVG